MVEKDFSRSNRMWHVFVFRCGEFDFTSLWKILLSNWKLFTYAKRRYATNVKRIRSRKILCLAMNSKIILPYHDLRQFSRLFKDHIANRLLCKLLEGNLFSSIENLSSLLLYRIRTTIQCNIDWLTQWNQSKFHYFHVYQSLNFSLASSGEISPHQIHPCPTIDLSRYSQYSKW